MKLLTKEIMNKIPALYSNENKKPEDVKIQVKFFTPWSNWTWFATEASAVVGDKYIPLNEIGDQPYEDILFFGMVHGMEKELGYFSYNELKSLTGPFRLKVERDLHFSDKKLSEVM